MVRKYYVVVHEFYDYFLPNGSRREKVRFETLKDYKKYADSGKNYVYDDGSYSITSLPEACWEYIPDRQRPHARTAWEWEKKCEIDRRIKEKLRLEEERQARISQLPDLFPELENDPDFLPF